MNAGREKFLRQWAGHPDHIKEMWAEIDRLRADLKAAHQTVETVHYVNVTVSGYDAEHWFESSQMLMKALDDHLSQFVFDGDEGAEVLYIEAIERLGRVLKNVEYDRETGNFSGAVNWTYFNGAR